ncbi:acyltransferase, partial [Aeromonas sp. CPF2-S1]|nr:acyltransferase [Aeromonas sp. CPF2-S1]
FNDKQFKRGFQEWLNARWKEKDDVLAQWQAADAAAQTDPQAAKASAEASSGS